MVNIEIRLIIFFAAKDGEAVYGQQKPDRELTVAQIMNSLLPNSDLNWRSRDIHWIIENSREFQKNIYFSFIDYAKAFDCVDHNKPWKILKEMGIPDMMIHSYLINLHCNVFKNLVLIFS